MRLIAIHHAHHPHAAPRALDLPLTVLRGAGLRVADIDRLGAFARSEILRFVGIEPDAVAVRATVDFEAVEADGLHVGATLGTIHRLSGSGSAVLS